MLWPLLCKCAGPTPPPIEITPASEIAAKRVDKLLKVRLLDGTDQWLYIHIEVQMRYDPDLPKRLFIYHECPE